MALQVMPSSEATLMMRPHLLTRIDGRTSLVVWKPEDRLIARIWFHFADGNFSSAARKGAPARKGRRPCRSEVEVVDIGRIEGREFRLGVHHVLRTDGDRP